MRLLFRIASLSTLCACAPRVVCSPNAGSPSVWETAPHARFQRVRTDPCIRWDTLTSNHLTLYAAHETYAATHLRQFGAQANRIWTTDLRLVTVDTTYPYRVRIFYFDTPEEYRRVVGLRGTGAGFPESQLLVVLAPPGDTVTDVAHELEHIISLTLWGSNRPEDMWQREGLGVLASAGEWPYSIDEIASQARRDGDRRTIADLSRSAFQDGDVMVRFRTYMLSASFVRFLLSEHGTESFRALWQRGSDSASSIYGFALPELEARWTAHLSRVVLPPGGIDLVKVQRGDDSGAVARAKATR